MPRPLIWSTLKIPQLIRRTLDLKASAVHHRLNQCAKELMSQKLKKRAACSTPSARASPCCLGFESRMLLPKQDLMRYKERSLIRYNARSLSAVEDQSMKV